MLSHALPYFEIFMSHLTELGKKSEGGILKPWTDIAEQCATKYYKKMDDTDAYVITLCMALYLHYTCLLLTYSLQSSILQYVSIGSSNTGAEILPTARRRFC
jgi:hypothetical protein